MRQAIDVPSWARRFERTFHLDHHLTLDAIGREMGGTAVGATEVEQSYGDIIGKMGRIDFCIIAPYQHANNVDRHQ